MISIGIVFRMMCTTLSFWYCIIIKNFSLSMSKLYSYFRLSIYFQINRYLKYQIFSIKVIINQYWNLIIIEKKLCLYIYCIDSKAKNFNYQAKICIIHFYVTHKSKKKEETFIIQNSFLLNRDISVSISTTIPFKCPPFSHILHPYFLYIAKEQYLPHPGFMIITFEISILYS